MLSPKFSVITVSYNHAEFIQQTIESVLQQNYPNFEHIIVDGGSNDGTIEILQRYPHLVWTSEPDRGQSHALNKGFAKASGEIIAWINSDDWYAPNIFSEVAESLKQYPVVMGACQFTDREGKPSDMFVPNIERQWFDILKYWVYYSSPAQPSIFFTRELLESVKQEDGSYVDEGLNFCMDFELWLRMAKHAPFLKRSEKIYSYFRNYETNKTGKQMDAAYREVSRVYKRYINTLCRRECEFSFLIPVSNSDANLNTRLRKTVQSLSQQSLLDLEVLLVDYAADPSVSRSTKQLAIELGQEFRTVSMRYCRSLSTDVDDPGGEFLAINSGIQSAQAPILGFLRAGDTVTENYCLDAKRYFFHDNLAMLLPTGDYPELRKALSIEQQGGIAFNYQALFSSFFYLPPFLARQAALLELGGFLTKQNGRVSILSAMRELMLRLTSKAWYTNANNDLSVQSSNRDIDYPHELLDVFKLYINAEIVLGINAELVADKFGQLRIKEGFALSFPEAVEAGARQLLAVSPANWPDTIDMSTQRLVEIVDKFPSFSPGWYLLSRHYQSSGELDMQKRSVDRFNQAREVEQRC